MDLVNKNILKLLQYLKQTNQVRSDREFCSKINLIPQNLIKIKQSHSSFTVEHIYKIASLYRVNVNWLMGLEVNQFRNL